MGRKDLYEWLGQFNERIESAVENEKSIAIVTSANPDGLCSGGIAADMHIQAWRQVLYSYSSRVDPRNDN